MASFPEDEHPRDTSGEFTTREQSAPEVNLDGWAPSLNLTPPSSADRGSAVDPQALDRARLAEIRQLQDLRRAWPEPATLKSRWIDRLRGKR
jgi:hypothetical protein